MDLIGLALLGLAAFAGKKKKTADKLEFFPENLELIKGKLVYTMDILNPTSGKLNVDSFFGGVYSNETKLGSIERSEPFEIAKSGRTKVKFPVKLVPAGIAALALGKTKLKDMKFKVKGIAKAFGSDFAVTKDLSLEGV